MSFSIDLQYIQEHVDGYLNLIKRCTEKKASIITVNDYIKGLMGTAERKNSWQLAEKVGSKTPSRFQHLMNDTPLDLLFLQNQLSNLAIEALGKDGILTFDDTGFLKKGIHSAGVQRQYTGTAGRIENCQIGTFMGYRTDKGHTLLDAQLYLPHSWMDDEARCRKARIPDDVVFQKKPLQAAFMYERFRKAGHRCSCVTADEAYGKDPDFIQILENHKQSYVVAIPKDYTVRLGPLKQKKQVSGCLEGKKAQWKRLSCGSGTKGERIYDWLFVERSEIGVSQGHKKGLLVRRSIATGELVYYSVFSPQDVPLETMVLVAGSRWSIEECFEMAKSETGLDHYEVRTYHGWCRHMMLSMWALLILVTLRIKMNGQETLGGANFNQLIANGEINSEGESSMEEYKKKRKILSDIQYKKPNDI